MAPIRYIHSSKRVGVHFRSGKKEFLPHTNRILISQTLIRCLLRADLPSPNSQLPSQSAVVLCIQDNYRGMNNDKNIGKLAVLVTYQRSSN